jgi:hypothetical protein
MNQDLSEIPKPIEELRKFLESPLPSKLFSSREWLNPLIFENRRCFTKITPIAAKISKKETKKVLFKITSINDMRPTLAGVYHDAEHGYIVASDAERLMAIPETGIAESWIEDKHGNKIDAEYPEWQMVVPDTGCTKEWKNYKDEIEIMRAPVSAKFTPVEYDIDVVRGAARLQKFIREDVLLQGRDEHFYAPERLLSVMEAFYATGSTSIELLEDNFIYLRDGDKKGIVCQYIPAKFTDTVIVDLYANDLL